jgi:hypothetical protein
LKTIDSRQVLCFCSFLQGGVVKRDLAADILAALQRSLADGQAISEANMTNPLQDQADHDDDLASQVRRKVKIA